MFKYILSWPELMRLTMRYSPQHKHETRQRIVQSARRLFNRRGFSQVSIDEIMEHAGLTRGGFYRHFDTKEQLYAEAVRQFLCLDKPEPWQARHVDRCAKGPVRARMIVDAYLSRDHMDDLDGSCPLAALPSDVARGGTAVKTAFRNVIEMMIGLFAANLEEPDARQRAIALTATCVGAMVIARALDDQDLRNEFRDASRRHVLASAGWQDG